MALPAIGTRLITIGEGNRYVHELSDAGWSTFVPAPTIPINSDAIWGGPDYIVYGAGGNGYHYSTEDQAWTTHALPAVTSFSRIHGLAADHIYAVDVDSVYFWDGNTWTLVLGPVGLVNTGGLGIWVGAEDNVWAILGSYGSSRRIYHYDGNSWTAIWQSDSFWNNKVPHGVWGFGTDDVWVVGGVDFGQVGYVFRWNGSAWSTFKTWNASASPNTNTARNIWGLDPDNVWVGGKTGISGGVGTVHKWNGSSWTRQVINATGSQDAGVNSVYGLDANNIYAGIGGPTDNRGLWKLNTGTNSFDRVTTGSIPQSVSHWYISSYGDAILPAIDAPARFITDPYEPVVDLNMVKATLTSRARYYISRGAHDGTILQPTRFVLGAGWENPRWGEPSRPSQEATEVSLAVAEGAVVVEQANPMALSVSVAGAVAPAYSVQEVMVYARITNSPDAVENMKEIPFACATVPQWFHAPGQRFSARIIIPLR